MKTIYTMIDPYPYSQLTVHEDYKIIAKQFGYAHKFYTIAQFCEGNIDVDSSPDTIFMFECALLKISKRTTKDVKRWFPNCKIVALSSEGITYKHGYAHYENNPTREFEIYDGYDVDLWLDETSEIVEDYSKKGVTTDIWEMTTSEFLVEQFSNKPRVDKFQDMICLIGHKVGYRAKMIQFLNQRYKIQWGKGPAEGNYALDHLYNSFSGSKVVLGTTSPCWWTNRGMKGFRDWLGPICGTVLIYDDHPDVIKQFPTCPLYKYDDFDTIVDLFEVITGNADKYSGILRDQEIWIKENTIAKQLSKLLIKYNIIVV